MRLAALIRECDPYRHPIGAHNWEQKIPLHNRLGSSDDIDVYLVQTDWFKEIWNFKRNASLCMYMESQMSHHSPDRDKVVICAEFGYEEAKDSFTVEAHNHMDHHHTRRGQWRAGFCGYPVIHGFNNTWGPHFKIESDAVGAGYLIHYYHFMTEEIRYYEMSPSQDLFRSASGSLDEGTLPLCMANDDQSVIVVYFPVNGECEFSLRSAEDYSACWFNPCTGDKTSLEKCKSGLFISPDSRDCFR